MISRTFLRTYGPYTERYGRCGRQDKKLKRRDLSPLFLGFLRTSASVSFSQIARSCFVTLSFTVTVAGNPAA